MINSAEQKVGVETPLTHERDTAKKRRRRFKYVSVEYSRHGRKMYFFRRDNKSPRYRLPDEYGSKEFIDAWNAATVAKSPEEYPLPPSRQKRRKFLDQLTRMAKRKCIRAKGRAQHKGWEYDIDWKWFLEQVEKSNHKCPMSGIPFQVVNETSSHSSPFAPSVDRIDCSKGYTRDNCRVIVYALNVMMSDWGEDMMITIAHRVEYRSRAAKEKARRKAAKV